MEKPPASDPQIDLPAAMRAFVLDGLGPDHASVRRIATPRPGSGQVVGRVDAAGICSSVNKVISQGSAHALMHGRNLGEHPAILGDEGVITVAAVGDGLRGRIASESAMPSSPPWTRRR